jgi:polyhydroxybutyrate depolymerase
MTLDSITIQTDNKNMRIAGLSLVAVLTIGITVQIGFQTNADAAPVRCRNPKRPRLIRCPPKTVAPTTAARPTTIAGSIRASQTKISITSGARKRTALLFVPGHNPTETLPLVVALHGGGGTGEKMAENTGFINIANQQHFAVVFPDGVDHNWNDGRDDTSSTAAKENVDDVGFITQLVAEVTKQFPVNPKRTYITGMSNGAMMTIRIACESPQLFAGYAAVSGTGPSDLTSKCKPSVPISLMQIHGTADPIVPYGGGPVNNPFGADNRGTVIGVDDLATLFVQINQCDPSPIVAKVPDRKITDDSTITQRTWKDCQSRAALTFLRVDGGGHVWPGERTHLPKRLVGAENKDIDATQEIWNFFTALHR